MKKLFLVSILITAFGFELIAQEALETDFLIETEGRPLNENELAEVMGGLPRCCHSRNYDPIEDKCLNNIGQAYERGTNDCDIWVEKVLKQAGIDISPRWGDARTTNVRGHARNLASRLSGRLPNGWSIEIIDNEHVALIRVNSDGSADVYHQGFNDRTRTTQPRWESRGYHYSSADSHKWGDNVEYWRF